MEKQIFVNELNHLIDGFSYSPSLYALLSVDGSYIIKRINIGQNLENSIKDISDNWIRNEILSGDFELKDAALIDENEKIFYGLESYADKLRFPALAISTTENFSKDDEENLVGLLIYINKNNEGFWLYQHKYKMTRVNTQFSLYAILNGDDCYEILDKDVFKIDHSFDFVVLNDFLASKNWKLMQQCFGFENYVRSEAAKYFDGIQRMNFISDTAKLEECSSDFKIAKKLMKLKNSKVLQMNRTDLLNQISNHPHYSKMFQKDQSSGNLIISTKAAVTKLLKMLNDDILHSDLTGTDYESSSKLSL